MFNIISVFFFQILNLILFRGSSNSGITVITPSFHQIIVTVSYLLGIMTSDNPDQEANQMMNLLPLNNIELIEVGVYDWIWMKNQNLCHESYFRIPIVLDFIFNFYFVLISVDKMVEGLQFRGRNFRHVHAPPIETHQPAILYGKTFLSLLT